MGSNVGHAGRAGAEAGWLVLPRSNSVTQPSNRAPRATRHRSPWQRPVTASAGDGQQQPRRPRWPTRLLLRTSLPHNIGTCTQFAARTSLRNRGRRLAPARTTTPPSSVSHHLPRGVRGQASDPRRHGRLAGRLLPEHCRREYAEAILEQDFAFADSTRRDTVS